LKIFDRWGEFIFETKDINKGWDGIYKGQLAPYDIYAWTIEYRTICAYDKNLLKFGKVLLLK